MKNFYLLVLTMALLSHASLLRAETGVSKLLGSYRVTVGASFNSVDFDVYPENSINSLGTLSEEFKVTPFVTLTSPYSFFADSSAGWFMEYSLATFDLNQQDVNDDLVDLGTSVSGFDAYIAPNIFYSFSGNNLATDLGGMVSVGLGVGIGYLKASGDLILTEAGNQVQKIDVANAGLAVSLFIEYQNEHFKSRISGGGTSYSSDGLEYDAFAFKWSFGYIF